MTKKNEMEKQEIDIHRLELRYSHIRVQNHSRIRRLADSISRHGQLKPLLAVTGAKDCLILIDGYQRQAALSYLGKDTALVLIMRCSEDQALFQLLIKRGERHWEVVEEAGIIQELYRRFDCSFDEIGSRIGRNKSYVKRRLDLLESLPEEILKHVLSGAISTWSAGRILVPLARANAEDATKLAANLEREPMSTRQLHTFYDHYQKSNRKVRERMLAAPGMFIKSLQAIDGTTNAGPEEKWLRDAKAVCGILHRLQNNTDTVFYPNQEKKQRRLLLGQASRARRLTGELQEKIQERVQDDRANQRGIDKRAEQTGGKPESNCQTPGNIPHHSDQGSLKPGNKANPEQKLKV